ncbi:hypothetical protein RD149_11075 [Gordonia westfalica]|uniref:Translation initiation factor IF-2 n=1 Tax=Gordonia westfalica TaxID=158898 RepID=A0ABU2GS64_9ACTN|nr:hypothetical protein [Gordonia westfalica]MDS1114309.1 hypothetical protein [Gordonia westfalica]
MNSTPNNPTPDANEPNQIPDAHPDAATTPIAPTPADDQPTEQMSETDPRARGFAGPTPTTPPTTTEKPKTPILIAGGLGVAVIAAALGFGAGYVTGDATSDRHDRVAVSRDGGDWNPAEGRGGQHGHFRGGPDGDGMRGGPGGPGRPGDQGPRGQQPSDRDSTEQAPQAPSQQPSAEQQPQAG